MVRNLDELLELKRLEIVNLDKQINSSHQQPSHKRISKSSDVRKEVCTTADKKVATFNEFYIYTYLMSTMFICTYNITYTHFSTLYIRA